jgi:shikimate dehydrogenase
VTIPYKEKVMEYLDYISPEARAIGAVNVIRVIHEGKKIVLRGYNSDVIGFTQSIEPMLESYHKKALVLGTGGASKAVAYGLKSLGIEPVFVSRYERPGTIQYQNITPDVVKEYNVIVNCTPLGMFPKVDSCPDLPYEALDDRNILYDLIYNPDETLFMKKGAERGAAVKNGLEMLLLQAFASWEYWNGKE